VPLPKATSAGSNTPACHCTTSGAVGCRIFMAASSCPRMFTCRFHNASHSCPLSASRLQSGMMLRPAAAMVNAALLIYARCLHTHRAEVEPQHTAVTARVKMHLWRSRTLGEFEPTVAFAVLVSVRLEAFVLRAPGERVAGQRLVVRCARQSRLNTESSPWRGLHDLVRTAHYLTYCRLNTKERDRSEEDLRQTAHTEGCRCFDRRSQR